MKGVVYHCCDMQRIQSTHTQDSLIRTSFPRRSQFYDVGGGGSFNYSRVQHQAKPVQPVLS